MASHKRRNGTLNVCYNCRQGNHQDCSYDPEFYICHCITCQPPCERPQCQVVKVRTPRGSAWKHDDPRWGR